MRASPPEALDADLHGRRRRRVDAGVRQQVREDLADHDLVAQERHRIGRDQLDGAIGRDGAEVVDCIGGNRRKIEVCELQRSPFVEPRQCEQLVDEDAHACGFVPDAVERTLPSGRVADRSRLEQLGITADRGQRRAQLVRGVGDERAQRVLGGFARVERRVESSAQSRHLVAARNVDAPLDLTGGDRVGGVGDVHERAESDPHEPQCRRARHGHQDEGRDAFDPVQTPQCGFDVVERRHDYGDVLCSRRAALPRLAIAPTSSSR